MRLLLTIALLACSWVSGNAATYYVSNSGLDSNVGTATNTPWQSLAMVNAATLNPGDSVLLQKGCVWHETLVPPASGVTGSNILFGTYGSGASPIINGSDLLDDVWAPYPGNVCANPSFEKWSTATQPIPAGWVVELPGTSICKPCTTNVYTGTHSIQVNAGASDSDMRFYRTGIPVKPGSNYVFSVWYNVPAGSWKYSIQDPTTSQWLQPDGTWGAFIQTLLNIHTGWVQYSRTFTQGAGTTLSVFFERGFAANINSFFDDVSISLDVPSNTNIWHYMVGVAWNTNQTRFDTVQGTVKADLGGLVSAGDFYRDGKSCWVYSPTGTNPTNTWHSPGIETSVRNPCVSINKSYITLDGLEIDWSNADGIAACSTADVIALTVQNCQLYHNWLDGIVSSVLHVGNSWTLTNLVLGNNGGYMGYPVHGMYLSHVSQSLVSACTITNQSNGFAVQIQDASNSNTVTRVYSSGNTFGFLTIYNNGAGMPHENKIYYNVSKDEYQLALIGGPGTSAQTNYLWNNTCIGLLDTNGTVRGVYLGNNSVLDFRNNILRKAAITGGNVAIMDITSTNAQTWDYNNVGPNGNYISIVNGSFYSTLAAHSAATGYDTHSLSADPGLNGAAITWMSPCVNKGVNVGLTSDFLGNPIVGTPDIGAYEYQAKPTLMRVGLHTISVP